MKHIQTFESFLNEAKKITITELSDSDAKQIWDNLVNTSIGKGNTDGTMAAAWDIMKTWKGTGIAKISVNTKYSKEVLIAFDVFPFDSPKRKSFYEKTGNKSLYMMVQLDGNNIKSASFKEASRMSNSEMKHFKQIWFNTNEISFK